MVSVTKTIVAGVALAASAAAQGRTIPILAIQDLSLEDTFVFKPSTITANVGDVLEFHFAPTGFLPSNHSVAQGTFDRGCEPMPSGFWSGNVEAQPDTPLGEADQVFQITVTTTNPIVFYCATGQHCTRGMYGVVNPSDSQNMAAYKAAIAKNGPAVMPSRPAGSGGQFVRNTTPVDVTTLPAAAPATIKASVAGIVSAVAFALFMM